MEEGDVFLHDGDDIGTAQLDQALTVAFPFDLDVLLLQVHILDFQVTELRNPDAGGE